MLTINRTSNKAVRKQLGIIITLSEEGKGLKAGTRSKIVTCHHTLVIFIKTIWNIGICYGYEKVTSFTVYIITADPKIRSVAVARHDQTSRHTNASTPPPLEWGRWMIFGKNWHHSQKLMSEAKPSARYLCEEDRSSIFRGPINWWVLQGLVQAVLFWQMFWSLREKHKNGLIW